MISRSEGFKGQNGADKDGIRSLGVWELCLPCIVLESAEDGTTVPERRKVEVFGWSNSTINTRPYTSVYFLV